MRKFYDAEATSGGYSANDSIPTAEQFLREEIGGNPSLDEELRCIEFAKIQVTAALKAASKIDFDNVGFENEANDYEEARDMAIMNSYPLTNIK